MFPGSASRSRAVPKSSSVLSFIWEVIGLVLEALWPLVAALIALFGLTKFLKWAWYF